MKILDLPVDAGVTEFSIGMPEGEFPDRNMIRTLGCFQLTLDGVPIKRWNAGRARSLFQYLLLNVGRPVAKATLIEVIWQDSPARVPETALKVAVHSLRRLFADTHARSAAQQSGEPGIRIVSRDSSYLLDAAGTWVDLGEFESAMDTALRLDGRGNAAAAVAYFRRASRLYGGQYLPDCVESWAMVERERLKDLQLHALDRQAADAERCGDLQSAARLHHRMLGIDPCREESYRSLMRCHAEWQQPGRVVEWYRTCVRQLNDRLDAEPTCETDRVFRNSLNGESARRSDGELWPCRCGHGRAARLRAT